MRNRQGYVCPCRYPRGEGYNWSGANLDEAMTVVLDLPSELESRLATEASQVGMPLSTYILRLLTNGTRQESTLHTGAELVAYWQQQGLVGVRSEIKDSQQHARSLRKQAEQRERP